MQHSFNYQCNCFFFLFAATVKADLKILNSLLPALPEMYSIIAEKM